MEFVNILRIDYNIGVNEILLIKEWLFLKMYEEVLGYFVKQ